jgi:hypothetical protein
MNQLNLFYQNQGQREAVRAYMIDTLAQMAIEKTFEGLDVSGIKDAKNCIDRAFDKLEEEYGKIETTLIPNSR